jgi:hypothetical protein
MKIMLDDVLEPMRSGQVSSPRWMSPLLYDDMYHHVNTRVVLGIGTHVNVNHNFEVEFYGEYECHVSF